LTDPRWTLVYFDDVAVVFVRRADNQELISESRRQFFARNDQATKGLLGPLSPSQCHEEKTEALSGYASVLALMGNTDQAIRYYARALDFGPSTSSEMDVRLHLADLNAVKGDLAAAREHLRRAARLDPANPALLELRKRIGG